MVLLCILLISVLMLTGCASGMQQTLEPIAVSTAPQVSIPSSLLVKCPDLPQAADGSINTLLANHVAVTRIYHACKASQSNLVDAVRGQKGIYIDDAIAPITQSLDGQAFVLSEKDFHARLRENPSNVLQKCDSVVNAQQNGSFLGGDHLRGQYHRVLSGVRGPGEAVQRLYRVT
jgi:hypothetical protein